MIAQRKTGEATRRTGRDEKGVPQVRGFIFDIDGTLALADPSGKGYRALPGAREIVSRLNAAAVPAVAFTNGTLHTPEEYQASLSSIGIEFPVGRVITPASVAAEYFVKRDIRRVLVLGIEGAIQPLREAGLDIVRPDGNLEGVQAVLVAWFPGFRFSDLDAACRAVWAGAALFTVSNAPFFASRGGRMLGISGAIVAMVTSVTGRRAMVLGKPSVHGVNFACARMGLRPAEIAVVGDDPALEASMARRAGALAIGVLTGVAGREAYLALPKTKSAHIILDSIADLLTTNLVPAEAAAE
jgi:4-nitrophenyl phosphatase